MFLVALSGLPLGAQDQKSATCHPSQSPSLWQRLQNFFRHNQNVLVKWKHCTVMNQHAWSLFQIRHTQGGWLLEESHLKIQEPTWPLASWWICLWGVFPHPLQDASLAITKTPGLNTSAWGSRKDQFDQVCPAIRSEMSTLAAWHSKGSAQRITPVTCLQWTAMAIVFKNNPISKVWATMKLLSHVLVQLLLPSLLCYL